MLITGKKRPFCFVLKQEKALERGKIGLFHIKTSVTLEPQAIGSIKKEGRGRHPPAFSLAPLASLKSISFYVILERSDGIHTFHTVV